MKKLTKVMLIVFLVFSNYSMSPTLAKEANHSEANEVNLYIPDSDEDLLLYEDEALTEELTHIQNSSQALLLEHSEVNDSSKVKIELESKEELTGYVQTNAVEEEKKEELLEYKLYTKKADEQIQVYLDETLEEKVHKLAEATNVLVDQRDLEASIEAKEDNVFISLNPEKEIIPEELVDEIKEIEDIQGFVEIKHLVSIEDEAAFLEKQEKVTEEELVESEHKKQEKVTEEELVESEHKEQEKVTEEELVESEHKEQEEVTEEELVESENNVQEEVTEEELVESENNVQEEVAEEELTEFEQKENSITLFSMKKSTPKVSNTSKLGHIRGGNRLIYQTLGEKSLKATSKHRNAVYYIKQQAEFKGENYYLLSSSPSATRGVLGWMKASDVDARTHKTVTKTPNKLVIKGTGKATSKAWGGNKDTVHTSMSRFKGNTFNINLTEKIGNSTWYRGKVDNKGANIWLHSSQTEKYEIKESRTSRLGHVRGGNRLIYEKIEGKSIKASAQHRNAVYYIKRQAKAGSETYYLLSTSPSATRGVLGWMKASDVSTNLHVSVTKTPKKMSIKGTGKATSKAWGGSKNTVHSSLSKFKGQTFHINLTEKVGNNTWYRGKVNNKGGNVWLHSNQTQAVQTNSNTGHVIVLDAGHGGSDPGASRNGVVEKEVVLDVTLRAEKILKARGYRVILTRSTDRFVNLSERSNIANRNKASSFLSIHANSGGGIGAETWWYNRNNATTSKKFAQVIQSAVVNSTKARDRGIKHGNLSVNRESNMTSALLEIGFVDSVTEAQQLKRSAYRNQIAIGIANGFDNYYK